MKRIKLSAPEARMFAELERARTEGFLSVIESRGADPAARWALEIADSGEVVAIQQVPDEPCMTDGTPDEE